jgi:hypothetical protein
MRGDQGFVNHFGEHHVVQGIFPGDDFFLYISRLLIDDVVTMLRPT